MQGFGRKSNEEYLGLAGAGQCNSKLAGSEQVTRAEKASRVEPRLPLPSLQFGYSDFKVL